MLRLIAAVWLALLALPAAAQTFPEHGGSPVVDQADLLRPEQELDLKSKAEALHAQTGRAFAVATVKSLEGLTIEDYGYRLGRHWGLGGKDNDDGVILLVAPKERKVRIETGYGAEGFLPDIVGGRIIRDTILPRFREKDMAGGIMAGADQIIGQMKLSPEEAQQRAQAAQRREEREPDNEFGFMPVVIVFLILVFMGLSIARRSGGRRYLGGVPASRRRRRDRGGFDTGDLAVILWGLDALSKARTGRRGGWGGGSWGGGGWGGGGGGGFGGFGGGSFGGGGASWSW